MATWIPPGLDGWQVKTVKFFDNVGGWFGSLAKKQWGVWAWGSAIISAMIAVSYMCVGICLKALFFMTQSAIKADEILASRAGMASPAGTTLAVFEWLNSIVPLEEGLILALGLLQLRICMMLYRLVKSWIPTLT